MTINFKIFPKIVFASPKEAKQKREQRVRVKIYLKVKRIERELTLMKDNS